MTLQNLDRVKSCMNNCGILLDYRDNDETVLLIEDSLQFISFIVELENEFDISIPDEILSEGSAFSTLERFAAVFDEITNKAG